MSKKTEALGLALVHIRKARECLKIANELDDDVGLECADEDLNEAATRIAGLLYVAEQGAADAESKR